MRYDLIIVAGGDGQPLEADDQLTTDATMCREMDMRFWPERVETEMRTLV